jgi:hypothetical protein
MTAYQDWQAKLDQLQAQEKLHALAIADIVYANHQDWQGRAKARAIQYHKISQAIFEHMNISPSQYNEQEYREELGADVGVTVHKPVPRQEPTA